MKALVFAGSNSRESINLQLVKYAAEFLKKNRGYEIELLDLNDFAMPLFGVDLEKEKGPQPLAQKFLAHITQSDVILISLAEHNGSYSVAFKNILDWTSRINSKLFQNKPMVILATSPGARGGISVLSAAESRFPFLGAQIKGTFSLPEFQKNFDPVKGITNSDLQKKLEATLSLL